MDTPFSPLEDVVVLPSSLPAPGLSVLPVHAFLLRGAAPLLVDAGMAIERAAFVDALDSVVDPADLAAIVVTHEDADHTGALEDLVKLAPTAKIIVSAVGAGKLGASQRLDPARLCVVEPGQRLRVGPVDLRVLPAPLYDSPATFMLLEEQRGLLFASDAFGAFVRESVENVDELDLDETLDGMSRFCRANSPWLTGAAADLARSIDELAALGPRWLFASHLPPAEGAAVGRVLARARALPAEGTIAAPSPEDRVLELAR